VGLGQTADLGTDMRFPTSFPAKSPGIPVVVTVTGSAGSFCGCPTALLRWNRLVRAFDHEVIGEGGLSLGELATTTFSMLYFALLSQGIRGPTVT
jgi:hypothetical protein